jgi:hypothetical protein
LVYSLVGNARATDFQQEAKGNRINEGNGHVMGQKRSSLDRRARENLLSTIKLSYVDVG